MKESEKNQQEQEIFLRLSFFEQQIKNLQQQLQIVEDTIIELSLLKFGLNEIKGAKGKEILASIGHGIYIKTRLESEELFVNIGEKKIIKKSVKETKSLIEEQIKKLEDVREQINQSLQELDEKITKTINKQ